MSLLHVDIKNQLNFDLCHSEWKPLLIKALAAMDPTYLDYLVNEVDWLPGPDRLFTAFSLPLSQTRYILLGESPYPRSISANGYAFWDNAVGTLWSPQGLSKPVNRATSLRNFIKMLLLARGDLLADSSQASIAQIDKSKLLDTVGALFLGMMQKGILLLNASLVYSQGQVPYHARQWKPFMENLLDQLALKQSSIQLILLGKFAKSISKDHLSAALTAEHPYNPSFITNPEVIKFFQPLDLLSYE